MKRLSITLYLFLMLSLVLSMPGTAAQPEKTPKAKEALMERAPGHFDAAKYVQIQRETFDWLMAEAASLSMESIFTIHVSDSELKALEDDDCSTCLDNSQKLKVGLHKPLGVNVTFAGLTPGAISGKSQFQSGGMMKEASGGGFVWTAAAVSPKAVAIRVHFSDFSLPAGSELYIYNADGEAFGPYTGFGPNGDGDFWSNTVTGSLAYIQLHHRGELTEQSLSATRFNIRDVAHLGPKFLLPFLQEKRKESDELSKTEEFCSFNAPCIVDAQCYDTTDWPAIDDVRLAVAHMQFVSGMYIYICSGGLLTDTDPSTLIPYFLTANHCINLTSEANSLECYWQFWTAYCGAACYNPVGAVPRTIGSVIQETNPTADFTLLELNQMPPAGSIYLGWSTTAVAYDNNLPLYRLSHPKGAPQAFSRHRVDTTAPTCPSWPRGSWIYSRDVIGGTEGGSSGSPVLTVGGLVVGQLSGACGYDPEDPCNPVLNATVDGAFASYYPQVEYLLDPDITEPPAAPSHLNARANACNRVVLTWVDNSDNENGFNIERSEDGVTFAEIDTVAADVTTYTDTGLSHSTKYWYRVRAYNGDGFSDYSNVDSTKTFGLPYSPSDLNARQTGNSEITLKWTYPPTSVITPSIYFNMNGFKIYRGVINSSSISANFFELIATVRPSVRAFKDVRIQSGRVYYYKVCAFNACGETCSDVVKIKTE